jgi:hypothetical protein
MNNPCVHMTIVANNKFETQLYSPPHRINNESSGISPAPKLPCLFYVYERSVTFIATGCVLSMLCVFVCLFVCVCVCVSPVENVGVAWGRGYVCVY